MAEELRRQRQAGTGDYLGALKRVFLDIYPHDVPLMWFDMELLPLFGVDVVGNAFDKERGCQVYRGELADILLLKLERTSNCVSQAMEEFLGPEHFELVWANEGDEKWYGEVYREFKSKVPLPARYLDRIYESPLMCQF